MNLENIFKKLEYKLEKLPDCNYVPKYKNLNKYQQYKLYKKVFRFDIISFFENFIKHIYNIELSFANKYQRVTFSGKYIKYLKNRNIDLYNKHMCYIYKFRDEIYKSIYMFNHSEGSILRLTYDDIEFIEIKPLEYYVLKKYSNIVKIKYFDNVLALKSKIIYMDENYNILELKNFKSSNENIKYVVQKFIDFLYKNKSIKTLSPIENINIDDTSYLEIYKEFIYLL